MEDAWTLGSLLPHAADPAAAFKKYQQARVKRAHSIQKQSQALGWIVQAENPLALAARDWRTPRIPESILQFGMRSLFADQTI